MTFEKVYITKKKKKKHTTVSFKCIITQLNQERKTTKGGGEKQGGAPSCEDHKILYEIVNAMQTIATTAISIQNKIDEDIC